VILLLFFLFVIVLLVLYAAGITKDGTPEEKAAARRRGKTVLYRLWLIGSGLWIGFWLLMLFYTYDHFGQRGLHYEMLWIAVLPPACVYGLARLLQWALRPTVQ
jgi:hypothetical protein